MRRDVGADAQPLGAEERGRHQRRRGLAVRPDDVDRPGSARCGSPSVGEQRAHAAEPELLGPRREPLEPAATSSAVAECARARAGSARASRARPRRPPRGAFWTKRSFASIRLGSGRSPCAAARARPRRAPSDSTARRSGFTTASKIRFSSPSSVDERAAAPERRRGAPGRAPSPRRRPTSTVPGSGHGPRISRAVVELRPDLLGHVRQHRVEQREQPLERGERRRRSPRASSA